MWKKYRKKCYLCQMVFLENSENIRLGVSPNVIN